MLASTARRCARDTNPHEVCVAHVRSTSSLTSINYVVYTPLSAATRLDMTKRKNVVASTFTILVASTFVFAYNFGEHRKNRVEIGAFLRPLVQAPDFRAALCTIDEVTYADFPDQYGPIFWQDDKVFAKYKELFERAEIHNQTCQAWKSGTSYGQQYTSQFGQDHYLYTNIFKHYPNDYVGTFVEAAAFNPVQESNSFFFEKCLGWNGICVEPQPANQHSFMTRRSCNLVPFCISDKQEVVTFQSFKGDWSGATGVGSVKGALNPIFDLTKSLAGERDFHEFEVTCFTLQHIFDQFGINHVDYLSLDVESYEMHAVHGIDFNKVLIDVITVENSHGGGLAAQFLIDNHGYRSIRGKEVNNLALVDYVLVREGFRGFHCSSKIPFLDSYRMCHGDKYDADPDKHKYKSCS